MYCCQRCGVEVAITFFDDRISDQELCELCFEILQERLKVPRG
ncbi:MAG TPA: hypothetical protein VGB26_15610 [Nitrospiria bacterium]